MTEKELLQAIDKAEQDRILFKGKISKLQKQIMGLESGLIEETIRKDRLIEELDTFRSRDPIRVPDLRELEIEAFRKALPGCLKIIEAEDAADNLKK